MPEYFNILHTGVAENANMHEYDMHFCSSLCGVFGFSAVCQETPKINFCTCFFSPIGKNAVELFRRKKLPKLEGKNAGEGRVFCSVRPN